MRREKSCSYQQRTAYDHEDSTAGVAGLRIDRRDLVLDLLEGQVLCVLSVFLALSVSSLLFHAYLQLLDNRPGALCRCGLECEHGVIALSWWSVPSLIWVL